MNTARVVQACGFAAALAYAGVGFGQAYIQQGNALDSNPRVGSGGLNYGARPYSSNLGNRIVSGNVAGGASFRGYSPVRDPSSLFFSNYGSYGTAAGSGLGGARLLGLGAVSQQYGLPSDRLSEFTRDSVSVASIAQSRGSLARTPYYSPSSTVANTGAIISGLNRPGSSQLKSPYSPARPDLRATPINPLESAGTGQGSLLQVSPRLVRIDNGQRLSGQVNERLLGNRLFGAVREVPMDMLAAEAQRSGGGALTPLPTGSQLRTPQPRREAIGQPRPDGQPGVADGPGASAAEEKNGAGATGRLRTPPEAGTLVSTDVFSAMRRASSSLARPLSPTERAGSAQAGAKGEARQPIVPVPDRADTEFQGPVRTFVGTRETALNRRLEEAEDLLKQGQYYRAADAYGQAQVIDYSNPLPLVGRSMALLAAGDYVSSANALFTAIRLFESLSMFQIDLNAFVPITHAIESRRTDLESRLEVFDDFRLRFLLGYLQFSTGQGAEGIANMERAAQKAPVEFDAVHRFVGRLKERAADAPDSRPAN